MSPAPERPASLRVRLGSILFLVGEVASTLLFAVLALLAAPLPFRLRYDLITLWTHFNLWSLARCCGLEHRVVGAENVTGEAAVVLCKHESAWETLALQTVFRPQSWVLKRELLWIPFFGWGLALLRPIAIDRRSGSNAMRQLLKQGARRLEDGIFVVVFPEGTRIAPGTRGTYRRGGAVLARHAGRAVIPVAHNAGDYWPRNSFLKYPGTIQLSVGAPIDGTGLSADELTAKAETWIENTVAELRGAYPCDSSPDSSMR